MTDKLQIFEIEKAATIQYDVKELLKSSLSADVLQAVDSTVPLLSQQISSLSHPESYAELKELRRLLKNNCDLIGEELYAELDAEVKEITDDFRWKNSRKGRLILQIEKWITTEREKIKTDFPDTLIYIGRSLVMPESLIIGGCVDSETTAKALERYFNDDNPPIPVDYKFVIV